MNRWQLGCILNLFGYDVSTKQTHSDEVENEAVYQNEMAQRRNAHEKISNDIKNGYETEKMMLGLLPGMSSLFNVMEKRYGDASGSLLIDIFGGDVIKAGFGIALPAFNKTLNTTLNGIGSDLVKNVVNKSENISTHLTDLDIKGAVADILGTPIYDKKGVAFQHYKEVTEALDGIGNQIKKLTESIGSGKVTGDVLEEAKRVRNGLQKEKDRITNILNRAKKVAEKSKTP